MTNAIMTNDRAALLNQISDEARFVAGQIDSQRNLTVTRDAMGFVRAELPINDNTFSLVDLYGKRFFSRKMLKSLGYTEGNTHLRLTINSLHREWVDKENSQYGDQSSYELTVSFKETATRLVLNAGNRRNLIEGMTSKQMSIDYLSQPHEVALYAGETDDGKGATILEVVVEYTPEVAKAKKAEGEKRLKQINDDIFGERDDELADGQAF
jgi:hypothetical protein